MNFKGFVSKNIQAFLYAFTFCMPILSGALLLSLGYEKIYIFVNSFLACLSLVIFLKTPKKIRFYFGFFVGMLLFYWISFSFLYSLFPFLIPIIVFAIALIYGGIFTFLLWSENLIFRAFGLLLLGFIHPFYFDWLFVESFFAYSFFGVDKISFICLVCGSVVFCFLKGRKKLLSLILFITALLGSDFYEEYKIPLDIELVETRVPQAIRWDFDHTREIIQDNLDLIQKAILKEKEVVVLPETAFPIALNKQYELLETLKAMSQKIVIVAGGIRVDGENSFNSTYVFNHGDMQIIDKVVLAPFGEKIPLPDFLAKYFYKIFFGVEEGLQSASKPRDFKIKDMVFRNAICYEGTSRLLFLDHPKNMIMISNNAWFFPSIEPYFQQILLKYYARNYNTTIFHSVNFSKSMIIVPSLFSKVER